MSKGLIQFGVEGDKAILRELGRASNAIPTNVLKTIFMKALKPIEKQAKKNARAIRISGDQLTKRGKVISDRTKQGRLKGRYKNKAGSDLAKAIGTKKFSSKRFPGANVSIFQSKLPTVSRTTGKPYKAFGRKGVPIAQWLEMGTKERQGRGKIKGGHPVWRAYKTWNRTTIKLAEQGMMKELAKFGQRSSHLTFTKSSF